MVKFGLTDRFHVWIRWNREEILGFKMVHPHFFRTTSKKEYQIKMRSQLKLHVKLSFMIILGLVGSLSTEVYGTTLIKRMEASSSKEVLKFEDLTLGSERALKNDLGDQRVMKSDEVEDYGRPKLMKVKISNPTSNLPHITHLQTIVKGNKIESKKVKWDQGNGKGQGFWEFYEKVGNHREKLRSAQGLVKVEIKGEDPYYPIMIKYQVPQNQWVVQVPEILHDENQDSWSSLQKFFDQGKYTAEHKMELLFQGGLEGIDPGATSSTSKFFLAKLTAPKGYKLNIPTEEHASIIKIPVAELSETIQHFEKNQVVVHVGLSHLVAGISWNSIRFGSEPRRKISESLMKSLETLKPLRPITSFQDFNQVSNKKFSEMKNIYSDENLPHITQIRTLNPSKFLSTLEAEWKSGEKINHEVFVQRPRKDNIGIDSVSGLVEIEIKGEKPYIPLLIQYRVPLNKWILETPAGLRDEGESPLGAFQREFLEEVGDQMGEHHEGSLKSLYGSEILHQSGIQAKDPSSSRATAQFFIGKVKAPNVYKTKETKHEASENIKVIKVPSDLLNTVIDYWKENDQIIEAGLSQFRIGMYLNSKHKEQELKSIERLKHENPELLNQLENILLGINPPYKSRL
ncbi:uncharacterized protein MELLADRAFT_61422 [Melampsora larici-populina 98AG31]|uniref:Nudix hydrolase domain-containing protein n=1 Tax=Melampsora larici-populina (strain 98AG31 / pathotype 3-4-7) TaxID=747676 RepID=F4REU8_MELLP|nr:uncharacterized protein MELLADRAFT_61422 [Melampsora larici-populina 98AG31]EGG09220.1 hypothetical protein MELLADRAFT_61422 [Melampsora larici-populina 98AG31]